MRPQRPIKEGDKESLKELLKKTSAKADFQRVQCVWLRAALGMSSQQIAQAVGWSPATVKKLWSEYFCVGKEALSGKGRGGQTPCQLELGQRTEDSYFILRKGEKRRSIGS